MAALVPKNVDAMVSKKDENVKKSSKKMVETAAKPTQQRRALNQIQNTVVDGKKKKKAGGDKKKTTTTTAVAAASALTKKEDSVDGKAVPDSAEKPRPLEEKKSERGIIPRDYLNNFDFDAPIEICRHIDARDIDYKRDDIIPPKERLSNLSPQFWNRFLMPSTIDFEQDFNDKLVDD